MEAAIKQQQYEVVGSKKGMKEDGEGEKMDKGMEGDGEGEKMDNGSGNEGKLTKNEKYKRKYISNIKYLISLKLRIKTIRSVKNG